MRRTKTEIMEGIESVESKVIANNTIRYKRECGDTVYRLHRTDIVTEKPDGSVILDSGGWQTVTTKERINRYLPSGWYLYQDRSIWYLSKNGTKYAYQDGMTILPDGSVVGGAEVKDLRGVQKRIKKYVRGFMEELVAGNIPQASSGDCWYCCMKTESGDTLGDAFKDRDHINSHLEESYYVPSLLLNALEELGASQAARHCVGFWMGYHDQEAGFWEDIAKEQVSRMLTRYLKRQMGLAR